MLTVKSSINGVTHICEQESVTIVRNGSERFSQILEQTKSHSNPDFVIWLPEVYADEECKESIQDEELVFSEREGVVDSDAIAILINDYENPFHPGEAFKGLEYQFIYPGDNVYVMNSHGSTIEAVK
ncbi:hypothetical protein [Rosenbergiella nectarea]|uniref:hypothetical protein n=1 Tax=Rosenbergiella nectarea TaxID=988801 RepID=UPI001F4ECF4C|nr:hypothetical protein [Rosenbergiella nectarea]